MASDIFGSSKSLVSPLEIEAIPRPVPSDKEARCTEVFTAHTLARTSAYRIICLSAQSFAHRQYSEQRKAGANASDRPAFNTPKWLILSFSNFDVGAGNGDLGLKSEARMPSLRD